ncbi:MAG: ComF family protein [Bacteroidetes bacterium]|nr:ComF family protein [Bacteroidota bacterium]
MCPSTAWGNNVFFRSGGGSHSAASQQTALERIQSGGEFRSGTGASASNSASGECLQRRKNTSTQTRKSRFERSQNVSSVFEVQDMKALEGKNIILVDDVITTGSTLVSAAEELVRIPGVRVSIVTIAFARG